MSDSDAEGFVVLPDAAVSVSEPSVCADASVPEAGVEPDVKEADVDPAVWEADAEAAVWETDTVLPACGPVVAVAVWDVTVFPDVCCTGTVFSTILTGFIFFLIYPTAV